MFKEALSWVATIVLAVLLAVFINNFIIVNANVPTGSMENTIMPKDRVFASRLTYYFGSPKRGDIAVFKFPDDESVLYVKRVIGEPGDEVEIKEGIVYINGEVNEIANKYVKETPDKSDFGPYKVPEGYYFMMGDNRNESRDSRYWENTYVAEDKMLGKVYFKYFPGIKKLE